MSAPKLTRNRLNELGGTSSRRPNPDKAALVAPRDRVIVDLVAQGYRWAADGRTLVRRLPDGHLRQVRFIDGRKAEFRTLLPTGAPLHPWFTLRSTREAGATRSINKARRHETPAQKQHRRSLGLLNGR